MHLQHWQYLQVHNWLHIPVAFVTKFLFSFPIKHNALNCFGLVFAFSTHFITALSKFLFWNKSQSHDTNDGQSVCLGVRYPLPHFYHCQLQVCWYGALSLTKGWVCSLQLLQLLLNLASEVILGLSTIGLKATFYCLKFETPPTCRTRSPHFYPHRNRVAQLDIPLPSQHWVSPNPLTNSLKLWSSPRGLQRHGLEADQSAAQLPTFLILLHDITIGAHPYVLGQKWRNSQ
jgi:hypothetical protein